MKHLPITLSVLNRWLLLRFDGLDALSIFVITIFALAGYVSGGWAGIRFTSAMRFTVEEPPTSNPNWGQIFQIFQRENVCRLVLDTRFFDFTALPQPSLNNNTFAADQQDVVSRLVFIDDS